jgi:Bacteriophage replication protein O
MVTNNHATFQGFQFPTTTPVPDEVFDVLMPQLSGAELKVLLYICRRTFGFKKASDTISLHQIATGIKTRDGRVLDGGTGLCKRHVQRALKVLEKKNIIQVTRKVDETGLYEVNTYSLNMLDTGDRVGTISPYGRDNKSPGVETSGSGGVGTPGSTTTNSKQETVIQETDIVVDVTKDLEIFGIAKSAGTRLLQSYPTQYIREKVAMAQGLVDAGSCLVSQNPAGWLRKAIEEDYTLPKTSQRHLQRSVREKKDTRRAQAKSREQHVAAEESQPAQNVATELRENNIENKEPEKTSRENETIWNKALERLRTELPGEEGAARLTGTSLIKVTETAARIFVPNHNAIPWLERRLYGQIAKAMKGVVGKDLDLQFVSAG